MATQDRPVGGFCSGTLLMTLRGEVPVESVRAGEKTLTLSGIDAHLKPVSRVRHRRIDLSLHPNPMLAAPVRVYANAIDDGVPIRDLRVSPDTALCIEIEKNRRVLIPALHLANGASILREPAAGSITYVTVSLERHDILMGDGMAAESGPGTAGAPAEGTVVPLRPSTATGAVPPPDFTPQPREGLCAPLLFGEAAAAMQARFLARAEAIGYTRTDDPGLALSVGDSILQPAGVVRGKYTFRLPPRTAELRLISRSHVPLEANPAGGDARRLGVPLARLRLGGEELAMHDGTCVAGFQPLERDGGVLWRWTSGDSLLALPPRAAETTFEVTIHQGWAQYWLPPKEPTAAAEA